MPVTPVTPVTPDAPDAPVLDGVCRRYGRTAVALHPVDLVVPSGRFLAVMGRSGSGKSTLLQCAAGLDRPSAGSVWIGGTELSTLRESELTRLRRERVGFVFQAHNLVSSLSVAENGALPVMLGGSRGDAGRSGPDAEVGQLLESVGLGGHGDDAPAQLSGGQAQRVAIARALITAPDVVFADEPTAALDPMTAQDILALLRRTVDRDGHAVVMVTHDPAAAAWADEVLFLHEGRVTATMTAPDETGVRQTVRRLAQAA